MPPDAKIIGRSVLGHYEGIHEKPTTRLVPVQSDDPGQKRNNPARYRFQESQNIVNRE